MKNDATPPDSSDTAQLEDIVGYLNFSSGTSESGFLCHLNEQFCSIESCFPREKSFSELTRRLLVTIDRLESAGGTFADVTQARAMLHLLQNQLLPAYRTFHHDLLFHQTEADLWRPFFIGRVCEALLAQGAPWEEHERIVQGALAQLNDYVGYRPVAMLDSENFSDPYPHEFVRPIPVYIRGTGVAVGRYEKLIQLALAILAQTDDDILSRANFDLDHLEEVAIDPRAYDFDHPVNRRPNYHFGQWDPRHISGAGFYTRFVLQQITLDALLSRCEVADEEQQEYRYHEAAAVLAGTMLMASSVSGDGPTRHDSTVTLSTLLPIIAAFRDDFYEQLVANTEGPRGERLRAEAQQQRQPFGAARQHLNQELARRRSLQMQHVHLAHLYARLGYPEAAQRQADSVQVAAARMVSGIYCHLTSGHDAIDLGELDQVADHLTACEDLIYRGIECGALVDPWNVVGFAGNFSLFPALENTIHDQRVDGLIELVEQVLDLGARAWSEAAAIDHGDLEKEFSTILDRMATWWDKFATSTVEDVYHLVAKETEVSANLVAGALNAWHKAGAAAGDVGFWRMFVDQFDTSKSFQLVIEALLEHSDTVASRALMMQWVSQKDRTPLEENDCSFRRLAFQWLAVVEAEQLARGEDCWDEVAKFFAYLEANAEEYWQAPSLTFDGPFDAIPFDSPPDQGDAEFDSDLFLEDGFDEDDEEDGDEDGHDELFEAAYEQMVYRDSTDDGFEGDLADEGGDFEDSEWEHEAQRLEQRLDFLTTVSNLWKHAAIVWGSTPEGSDGRPEVFLQGLVQTTTNYRQLVELLETLHGCQLPQPSGSHESLVEYDRLRTLHEGLVQRIIITCVETRDAARLLAATHSQGDSNEDETFGDPVDLYSVKILRAVLAGDAQTIRTHWQEFLAALKPCALLYLPHSRGGEPRQIVATRGIQQLLYDLLGWLPKLGLIRETCQLLDVAQEMELEHPVGRGAVTEFDGLFENGYQAIVRSMVASAELWDQANSSQQEQHADHMLVDALQQLTETQLDRWLTHSRSLRLSVVERLDDDQRWNRFRQFVRQYGADLFEQKFMSLGNLRGILHQGVDQWLDRMADDPEAEDEFSLIKDINHGLLRDEAVEQLSLAIETVVENYGNYLDYNTTTTQSDHGEQLYTLVDFLRVQTAYERVAWNLKPVVWAHEILVRRNRATAAEMWCQTFTERTAEEADSHLARLATLSQEYGMRLATVADRVGERFVRPLMIDRIKALVEPALTATDAEGQEVFAALEREIASLAKEPSGAGLDIPDWLAALEEEVTTARSRFNHQPPSDRLANHIGQVQLTWQELLGQLEEK
ncbi:MAG: hypothetical protein GXP28_04140 [Planctomycetes bacterium]|nr:hypothetical protein [Planctomycetota bacterium]